MYIVCSKIFRRTKPSQTISQNEAKILKQIESQVWPNINIMQFNSVKGFCAMSAREIKRDELICDNHGDLLSKAEGDHRYNTIYHNNPNNVYMYVFEFEVSETFTKKSQT